MYTSYTFVILRNVLEIKIDIPITPIVPIFKHFQKSWPYINAKNFYVGLENTNIFQPIKNVKEELSIVYINQLQ